MHLVTVLPLDARLQYGISQLRKFSPEMHNCVLAQFFSAVLALKSLIVKQQMLVYHLSNMNTVVYVDTFSSLVFVCL